MPCLKTLTQLRLMLDFLAIPTGLRMLIPCMVLWLRRSYVKIDLVVSGRLELWRLRLLRVVWCILVLARRVPAALLHFAMLVMSWMLATIRLLHKLMLFLNIFFSPQVFQLLLMALPPS